MKTVIRAAISMLLTFILSVAVMAQQAAPKSSFRTTSPTQDRDDRREHHPHIRSAINELEEAKRDLQSAAHDFGGHRVEAIKACDEAIRQLRLALQYDKK